MTENNLEFCVTCVTSSSLIQKMRERRRRAVTVENIPPQQQSFPAKAHTEPVQYRFSPLVIEWLSICLSEGHIQPSQSHVGNLEGWPRRLFFKQSLYIDFECWCFNSSIPTYLIPSKQLFYQVTDVIFESLSDDKYQFPHLSICREKFSKLLKEIKYDQP